jgi:hypothetical protein
MSGSEKCSQCERRWTVSVKNGDDIKDLCELHFGMWLTIEEDCSYQIAVRDHSCDLKKSIDRAIAAIGK